MTLATSRRQPGKLIADRIGLRGTAMSPRECLRAGVGQVALGSVVRAENHGFEPASMPKAALRPLRRAFCCFPPASPALGPGSGKQKTPRRASFNRLISLRKFGAGEGIRTLDPNLGKVAIKLKTVSQDRGESPI
jgi:hypothetical protein